MSARIAGAALLALGLIAAAPAPALAASRTSTAQAQQAGIERGRQVFEDWCAACHDPNPRLAGTLALQTKYQGEVPAALEERTDLTPELVSLFVRNGVAWMAPFRKTEISDAELADLGAYLARPRPAKKGAAR